MSIVLPKTVHLTFSEHGGLVKLPLYLKKPPALSESGEPIKFTMLKDNVSFTRRVSNEIDKTFMQ